MRDYFQLILCFLALGLGPNPAAAAISPGEAERLGEVSGLTQSIGELAAQMARGIREGMAQAEAEEGAIDPAITRRIDTALSMAFVSTRMQTRVLELLAQQVEPEHLTAVMAWWTSKQGAAVVAVETLAMRDPRDPELALQEDIALLATQAPPRRALLERMLEVTHGAESTANAVMGMGLAIAIGAASMQADGASVNIAELRARFAADRAAIVATMQGLVTATYARVYASMSDAAITTYIEFLETPAGQHCQGIINAAVERAMIDSAMEFGRLLVSLPESIAT